MNRLLPEEILTDRLRLRGPVAKDSETIFRAYAQDPEVCRYMIWVPHEPAAITRAFIAACIDAWNGGNRMPYVITCFMYAKCK
jgi:RimJ/RimL family protein N-acetyltransferase